MFGTKTKNSKLVERERLRAATDRAVEAAGVAAVRASKAAKEARRAASPVVRKSAHSAAGTLSEAAERAAEILADTADRLATSEAGQTAREKLAERAEALAVAVRPKKKHRVRKVLRLALIAGAITAFLKSPLPSKLMDKVSGRHEPEPQPEPITLPPAPARKRPTTAIKEPGENGTGNDAANASPAASKQEGS